MLDLLFVRGVETFKTFLHHPYFSDHDATLALFKTEQVNFYDKSLLLEKQPKRVSLGFKLKQNFSFHFWLDLTLKLTCFIFTEY